MFNIKSKIKKSVRRLSAYDPGLVRAKYKLDANESPFDLPAKLKRGILAKAGRLMFNRYPDPAADELKQALAKRLRVSASSLFIGNGSDEIVGYLMQAFVEPGESIIVPAPTFDMYKVIGIINGARVIEAPLDRNFDINENSIIKKSKKSRAKLIFIAYPNNPTGNCFSENRIMKIIESTGSFVVIDEAYFDFSGRSFLRCLKKHRNIIILRTFSKAFSMAAMRTGYLIANSEIVDALNKVRLPYNVNALSQLAAAEAVRNGMPVNSKLIISERNALYGLIKERYKCVKSDANFIFLKPHNPDPAQGVFSRSGVAVRMFGTGPAKGWMRLTVGTPRENRTVAKILKRGV